jgi:hypothetical protein
VQQGLGIRQAVRSGDAVAALGGTIGLAQSVSQQFGAGVQQQQQQQQQREAEAADNRGLLNAADRDLRAAPAGQDGAVAGGPSMAPALDNRGLLNASERESNPGAYASVAGSARVARAGDSISSMVGTSDPQTIGNFMRANNLASSNIEAGRGYFIPADVSAYGNEGSLGQTTLNKDNTRLAALAHQRNAFSDDRDARDMRESFGYQSRLSRELSGPTIGPSSPAVGEMRAVQPSAWEQIYGSPDVQHVMNHTITGQFILKPLLGAAGTVSALVRDDNYDFSKLRGVYGTELQQAKENLAIGIGTAFVPWPGKGVSSELVTGYRVEGLGNQRMLVGASGDLEIPTVLTSKGKGPERLLYVGFDEARAQQFLQQRLEQFPSNRVTTFEVPREFVYELRAAAVAEVERSLYPSRPVIADPTKASDQFGLTAQQIERLREVVVQGSGRRR